MLYTLGRLELHGSAYQHVKPLLFLAYLSLEGQQERRHVAEVFWSDSEHPLNALSALLFRLRRDLPGTVEADKTFVRSTVTSDAGEFLKAVEQGRNQRALELYRGTFLKDIAVDTPPLEDWLYTTREVLGQRAFAAAVELAEALVAQGELALATQQVEAALLLRETAVLEPDLLGRSYHLLYLGGSPKAEVLKAEAQEFELDLSNYETATTARPTAKVQHTLPQDTGEFVGRRAELGRLAEQLAQPECRLITLLGAGGVGKSRLALELAQQQVGQGTFQAGVVWVALEALTSPELVPTRIADALGVTLQGKDEPLQQVISFIGDKRLLLVLDNFEHLTAGAASIGKILVRCPNTKVIATSRTRLNLKHEWTFALEGLPYQGVEDGLPDAQALFYRRARRARLDFVVAEQDAPHLLELCRLVGGSPLALELAASWVRVMSVEALVEEIKANAAVLSSTHQDESARHQSMSAVLSQSWQLLMPEEQTALAKLSVFEGGFTRDAAAQVADVSLLMLTRLIDKSLLRKEEQGRYSFHPLVKQFAEQKLKEGEGEFEKARVRHLDYFLALAERAEPELTGPEQAVWLEKLDEDLDNLRRVTTWVTEQGNVEVALRLTSALGQFWYVRGYFAEAQERLDKALALAEDQAEHENREVIKKLKPKALKLLGNMAWLQSDLKSAQDYLESAVAVGRAVANWAEAASALSNLGAVTSLRGDSQAAQRCCEESLSLYEELGNQKGIAHALTNLGILAYEQGDYLTSLNYKEKSLAIKRKLGNHSSIAHLLVNIGDVTYQLGDYRKAEHFYREALTLMQKIGHHVGMALALHSLGVLASEQKSNEEACAYLTEALKLWRTSESFHTAFSLEEFGHLAYNLQQCGRAVKLWARAAVLRETVGAPLPNNEQMKYEKNLSDARERLGTAAFQTAWEAGEAMTLEEAISYALQTPNIDKPANTSLNTLHRIQDHGA